MKVKEQLNQYAKAGYMSLVKMKSKRARRKALRSEVAYLLSFPGNDRGLIQRLAQEKELGDLVIYYTEACADEVITYKQSGVTCYCLDDTASFFRESISRISKSRYIICDNYFAFMGALEVSDETTVFQIWHANGAIKTFGWQDIATASRSKADRKRFQAVYDACDYYVVGSDKMGDVFKESYHIDESKVLKTGCPRTDFYFEEGRREKAVEKFQLTFPKLVGERIVLYVPTYRPYETAEIDSMLATVKLPKGTTGFGHLHPHMVEDPTSDAFNFDLKGLTLEEMLYNTDVLITDYSSVPFEYGLIKSDGQVLFYCPDLEKYNQQVGLQAGFLKEANIGIVQNVDCLEEKLKKQEGLMVTKYADSWQDYNDGQSSERLIQFMKTK